MIVYKLARCENRDGFNICSDEKLILDREELLSILPATEIKKAEEFISKLKEEKIKLLLHTGDYSVELIKTPIRDCLRKLKSLTGKSLPLDPKVKIYFNIQKRKGKKYRIVVFHYPIDKKVKKTLFNIPYSEEVYTILQTLQTYWNEIVDRLYQQRVLD